MRKRFANFRAQFLWVFEEYRIGRLLGLLLFLLCIWFAAAVCIWVSERSPGRIPHLHPGDTFYSFADCLWSSTVYLVSGLEDFDPVTLPSKIAAVVVMVVGVGVLGLTGAQLLATFVERRRLRTHIRLKPSCQFNDHIVLCGWNERAAAVLAHLRTHPLGQHRHVVVVTPEALDIEIADRRVHRRVWGVPDYPIRDAALRRAGVASAHAIIVLSAPEHEAGSVPGSRDAHSILVCLATAALNPDADICVELAEGRSGERFRPMPGLELLTVHNVAGKLLAHAAQKHYLSECFHDLLASEPDTPGVCIVPIPESLVGLTFRQVQKRLIADDRTGLALLGVRCSAVKAREEGRVPSEKDLPGNSRMILNPVSAPPTKDTVNATPISRDSVLGSDDELVILARHVPDL